MSKIRHLIVVGTGLLILGGLPIARSSTVQPATARAPAAKLQLPPPTAFANRASVPVVTAPSLQSDAGGLDARSSFAAPAAPIAAPAGQSGLTLVAPPAEPADAAEPDAQIAMAAPAAVQPAAPAATVAPRGSKIQKGRFATRPTDYVAPAAHAAAPTAPAPAARALQVVPPPAPRAAAARNAPAAPTVGAGNRVAAVRPANVQPVAAAAPARGTKVAAAGAMAPAQPPRTLFSFVRLLNYSPHPTNECFLAKEPLTYGNNKYHFEIDYQESWKPISDEEARLQKIGFTISLFENGKKIRTLTTPPVELEAKKLAKGKVLGIAEVAPYRFQITVDSFSAKPNGIDELVFRLELINKG